MPTDNQISQITNRYITSHPAIKESLILGLINYSALARKICIEERLKSHAAVTIACQRFKARNSKRIKKTLEIDEILAMGKLLVRTNLIMAVLQKPNGYESISNLEMKVRAKRGVLNIIDGEETVSIIVDSVFQNELKRIFSNLIIDIKNDLVQLSYITSSKAHTTPGVTVAFFSRFDGAGINIYGDLTSHSECLLMIHEKDLMAALAILRPK